MIATGERQVAPTLDGIRRDHVARYEWAAKMLPARCRVVDFACGVGYGTQVLADAGHEAIGYDKSQEAIDYARSWYGRNTAYRVARDVCPLRKGPDAVVCFETIEHVEQPHEMLLSFRFAPLLLASVPNEEVFPHGGRVMFHHRHYTRHQFRSLLEETGWSIREWWGQEGPESEVEPAVNGRTIIAVCDRVPLPMPGRAEMPKDEPVELLTPQEAAKQLAEQAEQQYVPEHVTILGLGPSLNQYVDLVKGLGGKHAFCDEVWVINALGGSIMHDRVFHMDDVRIQERRAAADPKSNTARMLEWLRIHPGPVYTSRAHPDYPGLVDFPLEAVLNATERAPYFNSTAAYAIAYAIYLGVKQISLFGIDYTYPNQHQAEKGRACVEYWLGIAAQRGITVLVPKTSTLLDAMHTIEERLYGYDTLAVNMEQIAPGKLKIDFAERPAEALPTAAEMEARYDHRRHPNAIVEGSSK